MALPFNPLRVLIVADDQLSRAGLTAMLAQQSQVEVVGQATGDDDIDSLLEVYLPHVLVWDLGWNPVGSLASLSQLTEAAPPVLALLADDSLTAKPMRQGLVVCSSETRILINWFLPWQPWHEGYP